MPRLAGACYHASFDAGWSSPVARRAHNPKVAGSNPAPATNPKARFPLVILRGPGLQPFAPPRAGQTFRDLGSAERLSKADHSPGRIANGELPHAVFAHH